MTTERIPSAVDFSKMSDEQLNAFDSESNKDVSSDEVNSDAAQKESKQKPKELVSEGKETVQQGEATQPDLTSLAAQIAKLEKQIKDKEVMIGRQSKEIGDLRQKVNPEKSEKPVEKLTSVDFITDPAAAIDKHLDAKKAEEEKKLRDFEAVIEGNKQLTKQFIPEFENIVGDIKSLLISEDGLPEEEVERFLKHPYNVDSSYLIQLGRRAQASKEIIKLREENKKLKEKPDEMIQQLKQVTRQSPTVKSGNDKALKAQDFTMKDFANMTDEQLKRLEV